MYFGCMEANKKLKWKDRKIDNRGLEMSVACDRWKCQGVVKWVGGEKLECFLMECVLWICQIVLIGECNVSGRITTKSCTEKCTDWRAHWREQTTTPTGKGHTVNTHLLLHFTRSWENHNPSRWKGSKKSMQKLRKRQVKLTWQDIQQPPESANPKWWRNRGCQMCPRVEWNNAPVLQAKQDYNTSGQQKCW